MRYSNLIVIHAQTECTGFGVDVQLELPPVRWTRARAVLRGVYELREEVAAATARSERERLLRLRLRLAVRSEARRQANFACVFVVQRNDQNE